MSYSIETAQSNLDRGSYEVAFDMFMDLAQNELNADAQYALVKMCFDGHIDVHQVQKLFEWLNRETSLGNGYSFFNIGLMYERGLGSIQKDLKIAVQYYEKAIGNEVIDAYCNLGNIYTGVMGLHPEIQVDVAKGIALLNKGAMLGSRQAAYTLGCIYEKGEIVELDHYKAFFYLTLATLAKHDQAHRCLILMQHAVKKDFKAQFQEAERVYWNIEGMRRIYRLL
jgi:TPR repeat protein